MSTTNGNNGNGHKKLQGKHVNASKSRPKRRYSDKQKAAALVHLDYCQGVVTKASEETGVPVKTLSHWRDGRVSDDVHNLRAGMDAPISDLLHELIIRGLKSMLERPEELTAIDLGIFIDKHLIFQGNATQIIEHRAGSTPEERRARILELVDKTKVAS